MQATSSARKDSDAVVNTQSMLWPYDPDHLGDHSHVLVEADHADIIGHYALRESPHAQPQGRAYEADIFGFCTTGYG